MLGLGRAVDYGQVGFADLAFGEQVFEVFSAGLCAGEQDDSGGGSVETVDFVQAVAVEVGRQLGEVLLDL